MSGEGDRVLPVFAAVTREDGSVDHVRVGQAIRKDDRFELTFVALSIGAPPPPGATVEPAPASRRAFGLGGDGSVAGLEYLADRARRVLADPKKSKWHDEQRALLSEIEAELDRKRVAFAEAR